MVDHSDGSAFLPSDGKTHTVALTMAQGQAGKGRATQTLLEEKSKQITCGETDLNGSMATHMRNGKR